MNTLKKADTDEVKNFKKPSATVVLIISAVCDMMEVKPGKADDPDNPGKKIQDYWGPGKKLLSTPKFLDSLKTYDKGKYSKRHRSNVASNYR